MLKRLWVQNYAIIREMELSLSEHLTIITGETGAGKSILTGALGLIMGNRADTKVLFDQDKKCIVEGIFRVSDYALQAFFTENDLDYSEELTLRREIANSGKSRAFVNDTPVTLQVLQQLSEKLVDLHQQFDTGAIDAFNFQIKVLDALADNHNLLDQYAEAFKRYSKLSASLQSLKESSAEAAKERDFLQFQWEELENAKIRERELEETDVLYKQLSHEEEIRRALSMGVHHLGGEGENILEKLRQVYVALREVAKYQTALPPLCQRLDSTAIELQELSSDLDRMLDALESEGQSLDKVEARMNELNKLAHKYQVETTEQLLEVHGQIGSRLQAMGSFEEQIALMEKELQSSEQQLEAFADQLSQRRKAVVEPFCAEVKARLSRLSMENAQFSIQILPARVFGPSGKDGVEFMIATNKGSKLLPIGEIASGGELSRIALTIKSLVADSLNMPTLVFDEIDTGISGDVALKMGEILRDLSQKHQVVCITHSPQIASKASVHYFVHKEDVGERTVAQIRTLSGEERVRAIAIMLSSNPPSPAALENARELIEN
jgi:DNA repair protein RecN (Recombination protein N)